MTRVRAAILAGVVVAAAPADANPQSDALRARGAKAIYSLDHDEALGAFRQAVAADPTDAAAYRGLATSVWLSITFRRGNMTVDDYLGGGVNRPSTPTTPPPPEAAAAFQDAVNHAIALARARTARNGGDVDAHYQLGAAYGLRASYIATVEGKVVGAFRAAKEAYEEHETVLSLAPQRKDAGLIVGTYRYIVAALALPVRWVAYIAGFGGGRERGVRFVEDAAAYPGENQTDARFALLLLYNREKRYDDARKQLALLRDAYPRNRLVWLESGSTELRAGRPAEAERFLNEGMTRFASDRRPRMFGEEALWAYKTGAARAALGRTDQAAADLKQSIGFEGRKWVHGRAHFELGKLALRANNRAMANDEFRLAVTLCASDNDHASADEAKRLIK